MKGLFNMDIILLLFIFVIAAFLGKELISKIPSQLHTPLMSATNAISGITILGALVVLCSAMISEGDAGLLVKILAFIAIVLAAINVVGGYSVTQRMLEMFRDKKEGKK